MEPSTIIIIVIYIIYSKIKSILPLPLLNYDEAMIVILGLMIIKIGMDKFLAKKFNLTIIKKDK